MSDLALPGSEIGRLVADRRLDALYKYWQDRRKPPGFALRSDIDPLDIPRLLPIVFLIDVLERPRRFRYRLLGTELTAFAGRDGTGEFIDAQRYGEAVASRMQEGLGMVVDQCRPYLVLSNVYWLTRRAWARVGVLHLPLSTDGVGVNMLMGGMSVEPLAVAPADPDAIRRYALE